MVAQIRSGPANVVNIDLISITCGLCTIMLRFVQITRYSPNSAVSPAGPLDRAYSYYISLKQTKTQAKSREI